MAGRTGRIASRNGSRGDSVGNRAGSGTRSNANIAGGMIRSGSNSRPQTAAAAANSNNANGGAGAGGGGFAAAAKLGTTMASSINAANINDGYEGEIQRVLHLRQCYAAIKENASVAADPR